MKLIQKILKMKRFQSQLTIINRIVLEPRLEFRADNWTRSLLHYSFLCEFPLWKQRLVYFVGGASFKAILLSERDLWGLMVKETLPTRPILCLLRRFCHFYSNGCKNSPLPGSQQPTTLIKAIVANIIFLLHNNPCRIIPFPKLCP